MPWQVPSGRELRSLTSENAERQASWLAVTPERTLLSTSIVGDSVELWNIAGDMSHAGLPGFVGLPLDIAVSPYGRVLAVTGRERATTTWRRSANSDTEHHRLILLNVATLRQCAAVDIGQVNASTRPALSPSGDRIVVAT